MTKILDKIFLIFYFTKKNNNELTTNKVQRTIVAFCKTFSAHLFVTVHIHPHILVRFRETFLFCINITAIKSTDKTISDQVNIVSNIFSYLLNNNEYKIFKIVKIATAITKFIHQFI
jgi:hypothetical protein